jgi:hypothetical protein
MKKLLTIIIILATFSLCTSDVFIEEPQVVVPNKSLHIEGVEGLKLQDYIVTSDIKINSKLPENGEYKIKIYNFEGRLVNQERIQGVQGDNILTIYVSALPKDSYTVVLQTIDNRTIGSQIFSKN